MQLGFDRKHKHVANVHLGRFFGVGYWEPTPHQQKSQAQIMAYMLSAL